MGFFSDISGGSTRTALKRQAANDAASGAKYGATINKAYNTLGDAQEAGGQYVVDSYGTARNNLTQGYDASVDYLTPHSQIGQNAGNTIQNALGQNGQEAQQNYYTGVQDSAGFQSGINAGVDNLMSRYGVTSTNRLEQDGTPRSGRVAKGLQEYGNQYTNQYVDGQLNRLGGLQTQGYNADTQLSSLAGSYYGNQATLDLGEGQAYNSLYTVPAQTRLQGQLGQGQAVYNGETQSNNLWTQSAIAGANASNNLLTQGAALAAAPFTGGTSLMSSLGGYLSPNSTGGTG